MILLQCNYNVYMPPVHTGVLKCSSFSTNWQQWYMLYEDQCTARSRDYFCNVVKIEKVLFSFTRMLIFMYWFSNVKFFIYIWTCFKQGRKWLSKSGEASSTMAAMEACRRCRRRLLFCQKVGGQLPPLPPLQLHPCVTLTVNKKDSVSLLQKIWYWIW